jgi:hypothetical protein
VICFVTGGVQTMYMVHWNSKIWMCKINFLSSNFLNSKGVNQTTTKLGERGA